MFQTFSKENLEHILELQINRFRTLHSSVYVGTE